MQSTRLNNNKTSSFNNKEDKRNALLAKRKRQFQEDKRKQGAFGLFHINAKDKEADIIRKLISTGRDIQLQKIKDKNKLTQLKMQEKDIREQLNRLGSPPKLKRNFINAVNELNTLINNMPPSLTAIELQSIWNDKSLKIAEIIDKLAEYINQRFELNQSIMAENASSDVRNVIATFLAMTLLFKQWGKFGFLLGLALINTITMPINDDQEEVHLNKIFDVIEKIDAILLKLQAHKEKKPALKKKLLEVENAMDALAESIILASKRLNDIDERLAVLEIEKENNSSRYSL